MVCIWLLYGKEAMEHKRGELSSAGSENNSKMYDLTFCPFLGSTVYNWPRGLLCVKSSGFVIDS